MAPKKTELSREIICDILHQDPVKCLWHENVDVSAVIARHERDGIVEKGVHRGREQRFLHGVVGWSTVLFQTTCPRNLKD